MKKEFYKSIFAVKVLMVIAFFGFILFMFISNIHGVINKTEYNDFSDENRQNAKYPNYNLREIEKFPQLFDKAFRDNFKYRNDFIYFFDEFYFFVFNEINSRNLLLRGKEGTGFLSTHAAFNPERLVNRYHKIFYVLKGGYLEDSSLVNKVCKGILSFESFFEEIQTPLIIIDFPIKPYLQFEELPQFLRENIGIDYSISSIQQQIHDKLPKGFKEKYILNLYNECVEANDITLAIPKYNFHWKSNSYYTNIVASNIARRFNIENCEPLLISEYEYQDVKSDLYRFTKINLPDTKFKILNPSTVSELGVKEVSRNDTPLSDIFSSHFHYSHFSNENNIFKIAVVGDSFARHLAPDLARYFGEVITMNNNFLSHDAVVYLFKVYKPDFIVFLSNAGLIHIQGKLSALRDEFSKFSANSSKMGVDIN